MPALNRVFVWIWFALLVSIATYVRIKGADLYYYHADELMHIAIAKGKSLKQVLQFSLLELHPPVGHILRYYWLKFSDEVWFIRGQSLIFGLGMIPLYYAIGKNLKDELTGMCAAALVAFSHGCIIQSYVVRNYAMFAFFVSAAFYFYLLWRNNRNNTWLACYLVSSSITCLTHFSGIFTVFSIFTYEVIRSGNNKECRNENIKWAVANLFIAIISVLTYIIWQNAITNVHAIAAGDMASYNISLYSALLITPFYLMHVSDYLFPGKDFIFLLAFIIPISIASMNVSFNSFLALAAGSVILGITLFCTYIYPFAGDRHSLWMLPFFIVPVSLMISGGCIWSANFISQKNSSCIAAIIIFVICLAFYDQNERFSNSLEYQIKVDEWHNISDYLKSIDKESLIVSGRTDAIMLAPDIADIYNYIGNDTAFNISMKNAIIPYYKTSLLFNNKYDMRLYKSGALLKMIDEAKAGNKLDNYANFIFVNTYLSSPAIVKLILCNDLDKEIVSFPAVKPGYGISPEDINKYKVILVRISKQDLFTQLIPDTGKAHSCLPEI